MIRIICLLLFISISVYSNEYSKGDYCLYSFSENGRHKYDAELKMEVQGLLEDDLELLITQRNGAITVNKTVKLKKDLDKDEVFNTFFELMKKNINTEVILKSKSIINDYKFSFRNKKYLGFLIKATLEIDKKLYRVTYIFSKEMPILGLFRFTITQYVKSKKKYKFKNIMLIKKCNLKGKIIKL